MARDSENGVLLCILLLRTVLFQTLFEVLFVLADAALHLANQSALGLRRLDI